jgi:hypothetical protein
VAFKKCDMEVGNKLIWLWTWISCRLVNTAMNLWVPYKVVNLLMSWAGEEVTLWNGNCESYYYSPITHSDIIK